MEAVTLTAEQILANQKAWRQKENTLEFEFEYFDIEDDLNKFLSSFGDDYKCLIYTSDSITAYGQMIVLIETDNRADAEKYYELVDEWAMANNLFCNRSCIR